MERSNDWLVQAEHVLKEAEWCKKGEFYDGACFLSQQAAEMGVKALCERYTHDSWGHSISKLLDKITEIEIPQNLQEGAKTLDKYYIPTRYPNGFDTGAPKDFFTEKEAKGAINYATEIIKFCRKNLQK
ncbi:MAG: HEPN domain-containing protein [Euryarchaeota archaeon]|nr:HEPN domain-containing protein [Euryarchaeota archaeon]